MGELKEVVAIERSKWTIDNLSKPIETIDGRPFRITDAAGRETGEHLTLRATLIQVLVNQQVPPVEAVRVFALAMDLRRAEDSISLSEADYTYLKDLVEKTGSKSFTAIVLAQIWRALT